MPGRPRDLLATKGKYPLKARRSQRRSRGGMTMMGIAWTCRNINPQLDAPSVRVYSQASSSPAAADGRRARHGRCHGRRVAE